MNKIDFKLDIKTSFNAVDQVAIVEMRKAYEDYVQNFETFIINAKEQAMRDALVKLGWTPPEGNWKPIETAPRDGTWVLLAAPSGYKTTPLRVGVCRYYPEYRPKDPWQNHSNDSFRDGGAPPSHWMPLPEAPQV